jgi:saccharopine dehydrogenase-like NADP-dependent oxidoreductase
LGQSCDRTHATHKFWRKSLPMLATLHNAAVQADGRFLNDEELRGLQTYVQSYKTRLATYQLLSQRGEALVMAALRQLALTHRQEVQTHSSKCKRDMSYALQEIAKAVLTGDPEVFRQGFSLWMENITRAVHKGNSAARAYTCLKAEMQKELPAECAALVVPFIDDLITSFSGQ